MWNIIIILLLEIFLFVIKGSVGFLNEKLKKYVSSSKEKKVDEIDGELVVEEK